MPEPTSFIRWFKDLGLTDVPVVGGKNASLGELYCELASAGVQVPNGFAITGRLPRLHATGARGHGADPTSR